ncbi:glyoxylate/hydroxypyruvate reductase A [Variovorax sp. LjRoot290]|uniref:2-hydroxyacid dehydrogenase n=2 Tax=unclassified Variovorax TaxID=663243 RepID=UPI003ECC917F
MDSPDAPYRMTATAPHIFFSSNLDSPQAWREALARHLGDFSFTVGPHCADPAAIDVALVYKPPKEGLLAFRNLRAVVSLSAGINQFSPAMLPAGVPLSRSIDSTLTQHMIAYAKAAVYRYHRRFHVFERNSRESAWRFELPKSNAETTVGVLGLGELGSAVASALAADGFGVQGWSRRARDLPGIRTHAGDAGLHAMAAGVDIVINVLPLTDATEGILSGRLFASFRQGAFLINMGRGGHLVEQDLLRALDEGRIAAATLDVVQVEPLPEGHPFWAHPGILITPHIAGITSPESAAPQIAENIRRAMRGQGLLNQVDWARGY